ncbi:MULTISPECIES: TfoX/Sxy family DNA transformation protein [Vibrio]|uniref:TfoX/Sxy family DNA transformation protein n=1 Tax=Vibrio TaxID=662 RepID=UPI0020758402|nr:MULTISPECIES: TfoX/Sxy family DNA transformation protein [Vibrio]USD35568.1 TfoX/Sxy family DNA transformation protein [Vibrio sp. SCSIO 43186]USD72692.1 TfoX/Sxy family DNA transformation protein [Vibrio sp. SCSIO 43139]USD98908.1 hypothetical protein CTT30_22765 [Vibrio coralliilyticus]
MILEPAVKAIHASINLPNLVARPMFGGITFFSDNIPFAMYQEGDFYIRSSESRKSEHITAGRKPFVQEKRHAAKVLEVKTRYYRLSSQELVDTILLNKLAHQAYTESKQDKLEQTEVPVVRIKDLPNMQLTTERLLKGVGITTPEQMRQEGAEAIIQKLQEAQRYVSEDLIHKLQGAITGKHYLVVKNNHINNNKLPHHVAFESSAIDRNRA